MKDIKEYLHLYIGCECKFTDAGQIKTGVLSSIDLEESFAMVDVENDGRFNPKYEEVEPILRPLASMTDEEFNEFILLFAPEEINNESAKKSSFDILKRDGIKAIRFGEDNEPKVVFEMFRWILSKHFDIFNLIPEGLAIDAILLSFSRRPQ